MQASRMFEMLYMLLERDKLTAAELAERLEGLRAHGVP